MFPLAMNRSVTDVITVTNAEEKNAAEELGYVHGTEFWTRYNAGYSSEPKEVIEPKAIPVVESKPTKRKRG